jgi:hypothetical protein
MTSFLVQKNRLNDLKHSRLRARGVHLQENEQHSCINASRRMQTQNKVGEKGCGEADLVIF